jgi:glutathione S-transferase
MPLPLFWDWSISARSSPRLDVYLRLAELPYKLVPFSMESFTAAPKGKLPYIVDGDETIADSSFIVDYLKKNTVIHWTPSLARLGGPRAMRLSGCWRNIFIG